MVAEAYLVVDTLLTRRFVEVFQNRRAVGNRLRQRPRLEAVAKRVHVAVRADARIAEQIPGAADVRSPLEDDDAARRALAPQMHGSADTGDSGADDNDFKMLHHTHQESPSIPIF
jgi:hypothetical protein